MSIFNGSYAEYVASLNYNREISEDEVKSMLGRSRMEERAIRAYLHNRVDRYETDGVFVSTVKQVIGDDTINYFETAIAHKDFNGGQLEVVETCSVECDPKEMHNRWVKLLTSGVDNLEDRIRSMTNQRI